ncbi:PIG-L family deacetylase [Chloroflexi bacterium]|nr:PIG-L family deacetylase [Chloroflexota bacterium]
MNDMKGKRILVITPHPDDAESGAGGTIAKWSSLGADIVLVVCTNGNKGTSDRSISPGQIAETRRQEQLESAKLLGLTNVVFLDHPDQEIKDGEPFRKELVREVRRHRPDIVVTIDPERKWIRHQDHFVTGRVALDAVFPYARDYLAYPDLIVEGFEPHKTLEVYLWGTDDPDVFIDIDDHFEDKLDALYCHESQMSSTKDEGRVRLRNRFSVYGPKVNAEVAEAFKRLELRP